MFSLAAFCVSHSLLLRYKYDAAKIIFTARHEILATGCIQAPAKASTLFGEVAHRVAFFFVLDARLFVFAPEFFFVVEAAFEPDCFKRECFDAVRVEVDAV